MTQEQNPIQNDQTLIAWGNPPVGDQAQTPVVDQSVAIEQEQMAAPVLNPNQNVWESMTVEQPSSVPVQQVTATVTTQETVSQPTQTPSTEQPKGFFSKLFDGAKNLFGKTVSTTADIAGKTLQTGAQVVGGVTQTAVTTGATLAQWVGNAVQNNQDGNILQNVAGAVGDVAKTTINAGTQAVGGVVDAWKQTMSGVVEVGKNTISTVASDVPVGWNVLQKAADTIGTVADKAVNITGTVADKAVSVGTWAVQVAENIGTVAAEKVESAATSVGQKASEVGKNIVNQTKEVVQDIQMKDTGVKEWDIQQPVYTTTESSEQIVSAPSSIDVNSENSSNTETVPNWELTMSLDSLTSSSETSEDPTSMPSN